MKEVRLSDSDLLDRLRKFGALTMSEDGTTGEFHINPLAADCIAAIDDLQKRLDLLQEQHDKMKSIGDAIIGCIQMQMWEAMHILVNNWQEANSGK